MTSDADTPTIESLTLGCGAGREAADMAASAFVGSGPPHRPRTNVYVDGFNFYYAAFHSARAALPPCLKWLDVRRLCQNALPRNEICRIRYFTAKVRSTASDPGSGQTATRVRAGGEGLRREPGELSHPRRLPWGV